MTKTKKKALWIGGFVIAAAIGVAQEANVGSGVTALTNYYYGGSVAAVQSASPSYDGQTLAAASTFDVSQPATGSQQASFSAANIMGTRFGIGYELWHCLAGLGTYDIQAGRMGPVPSFHWRGTPSLGYYCLSDNRQVLRTHAAMLRDAGIDFVVVDITNWPDMNDSTNVAIVAPLKAMLEEWSKIHGAPKLALWPVFTAGGTLIPVLDQIMSQYPQMAFIYQGKPLMLATANPQLPPDPGVVAQWASKYTIPGMWANQPAGSSSWSYMQSCQAGFKESGGTIPCKQNVAMNPGGGVAQISVSNAYQATLMTNFATAVPKFGGNTFKQQMARIEDFPNVPIVVIDAWNEWIAQRFCYDHGANTANCAGHSDRMPDGQTYVFVDMYDDEYNRDMEPSTTYGSKYYDLLVQQVKGRKQSNSTIIGNIDAATATADGGVVVNGWACTTGYSTSISVQIFANGPSGTGTAVATVNANVENEEAVGQICQDGWTGVHRFSATLTAEQATRVAGQTVYAHGISPLGRSNLLIARSGEVSFPGGGSGGGGGGTTTTSTTGGGTTTASATNGGGGGVATATSTNDGSTTGDADQIPLYRFYQNGHHFISLDQNEGLSAGFTYEGIAFHASRSPASGGVPIYRCWSGSDNFMSNSSNCEGYKVEGLYGYLAPTAAGGGTPVWRIYNPRSQDHLATFIKDEGSQVGYHSEGTLGFAK